MGWKLGAVPLWGREGGSPSNTMWPGSRPTCKPSFTLIHPTVWPQYQYTNVTDRTGQTGRTDNGLIAYTANRFTNSRPKTDLTASFQQTPRSRNKQLERSSASMIRKQRQTKRANQMWLFLPFVNKNWLIGWLIDWLNSFTRSPTFIKCIIICCIELFKRLNHWFRYLPQSVSDVTSA